MHCAYHHHMSLGYSSKETCTADSDICMSLHQGKLGQNNCQLGQCDHLAAHRQTLSHRLLHLLWGFQHHTLYSIMMLLSILASKSWTLPLDLLFSTSGMHVIFTTFLPGTKENSSGQRQITLLPLMTYSNLSPAGIVWPRILHTLF